MSRSRRKRRKSRLRPLGLLVTAGVMIAAGCYIMLRLLPSTEQAEPDWQGIDKPIFVQGEIQPYGAIGTGEELKLPLNVLQEVIDPNIRYEPESESVILTTASRLMHLQTEKHQATLNNEPVQLRFAPEEVEEKLYLPIQPLEELYGIVVEEHEESGAVMLMKAGESIEMVKVDTGKPDRITALRQEPTIHSPILAEVPEGTLLKKWGDAEIEGWSYVQLDNGYLGYMQNKKITSEEPRVIALPPKEPTKAERSWKGKQVHLIWEAVYERRPDPSKFDELPGVNVVSPTWFSIIDGEGNVRSKADAAYVTWAHQKGMEVWGLISNSFEPDWTSSAMATFENRMRVINQMLEYAEMYKLDGINIDFENVYTKDGENVSQFVRELKPLAEEKGLILSMDVTPKSNSEMWSKFLDRRALGQSVDYLIVMTYDEHWAASPVAGSVSSLPWSERSIRRIIEEDEVPAEKIILGVPLYTRIWTEDKDEETGEPKVSSKAVSMNAVEEILKEKKLTPVYLDEIGQNYIEYKDEKAIKKIWIEDEVSLTNRVKLAQSLQLGGIASWTRGFGNAKAWEALKEIHSGQ